MCRSASEIGLHLNVEIIRQCAQVIDPFLEQLREIYRSEIDLEAAGIHA